MSDIPQVKFLAPDDSLAAAGDDLRDQKLIDQLVENGNLSSDWRPDPKDLC